MAKKESSLPPSKGDNNIRFKVLDDSSLKHCPPPPPLHYRISMDTAANGVPVMSDAEAALLTDEEAKEDQQVLAVDEAFAEQSFLAVKSPNAIIMLCVVSLIETQFFLQASHIYSLARATHDCFAVITPPALNGLVAYNDRITYNTFVVDFTEGASSKGLLQVLAPLVALLLLCCLEG